MIGHPQIRNRGTVVGSIAHADPAAELPAVLAALDGVVSLRSRSGERQVAAADFFDGPFSTARQADELLTSVMLPAFDGPSTTIEVARRPGDFALVGVFVAQRQGDARIAAFGVGDRPMRLRGAEEAVNAGAAPGGDRPARSRRTRSARRRARLGRLPATCGRHARHPCAGAAGGMTERTRERTITLTVNDVEHAVAVETRTLLVDVLRHQLQLTGTHVGCEQGSCGACTVIFDGQAVRSCLVLAPQADGAVIETIESVAAAHPVVLAMHEQHGLQCGFCTAGIVMSLVAAHRDGWTTEMADRRRARWAPLSVHRLRQHPRRHPRRIRLRRSSVSRDDRAQQLHRRRLDDALVRDADVGDVREAQEVERVDRPVREARSRARR